MVILHASFRVKDGSLPFALAQCETVLGPSRAEPGCISYAFFALPNDPQSMIFVEEWQSPDALKSHFEMDYVKAFFAAVPQFVEEPPTVKIFSAEPLSM